MWHSVAALDGNPAGLALASAPAIAAVTVTTFYSLQNLCHTLPPTTLLSTRYKHHPAIILLPYNDCHEDDYLVGSEQVQHALGAHEQRDVGVCAVQLSVHLQV